MYQPNGLPQPRLTLHATRLKPVTPAKACRPEASANLHDTLKSRDNNQAPEMATKTVPYVPLPLTDRVRFSKYLRPTQGQWCRASTSNALARLAAAGFSLDRGSRTDVGSFSVQRTVCFNIDLQYGSRTTEQACNIRTHRSHRHILGPQKVMKQNTSDQ